MTFIVATNVVASQPPKRRPTGTPTTRAKKCVWYPPPFLPLLSILIHGSVLVNQMGILLIEPNLSYSDTDTICLKILTDTNTEESYQYRIDTAYRYLCRILVSLQDQPPDEHLDIRWIDTHNQNRYTSNKHQMDW